MGSRQTTHVELIPLDLLKVDGNRALARLGIINVACSMRCQISVTVLEGWDFELPAPAIHVSRTVDRNADSHVPVVQAHSILYK